MIEKYIKPEELPTRLVEWKDPQPNDNEILIDVHYAGLNCERTLSCYTSQRTLTLSPPPTVFDSAFLKPGPSAQENGLTSP